jgi:hypothetical protein
MQTNASTHPLFPLIGPASLTAEAGFHRSTSMAIASSHDLLRHAYWDAVVEMSPISGLIPSPINRHPNTTTHRALYHQRLPWSRARFLTASAHLWANVSLLHNRAPYVAKAPKSNHSPNGIHIFFTCVASRRNSSPSPCTESSQSRPRP